MDDGQTTALVTALAVLVVVLAITVIVLVLGRARERRRTHEEVVSLRVELERAASRRPEARPTNGEVVDGYLITDLGRETPVPDRVVLSAVVGEPLLKAAAFAHGVRRALSPETRHRIAFTVRREIKRSRKERRREMRAAWQQSRRAERQAQRQKAQAQARERAA